MINKLALFINHNIFLTNEELKKILENEKTIVIGVSVPVWMNARTTKTTEPAKEYFCEYEINYNSKKDEIIKSKNGYEIFLKKTEWIKPNIISIEESLKMNFEERKKYDKEISKLWAKNPEPQDLKNLYEKERNFKKIIKKLNVTIEEVANAVINIQHVLNIKKINKLKKTLC